MSDFVASTPLAVGLLVAAGVLLLVIGFGCLRNRLLFWMGLRNMVRRPSQTFLLLVGLIVSTVLIVASFGLNDSLTYSAQQQVIQETGQFDETVTGMFSQAQLDHDLSVIRQHPGIQAATGVATVSGRYRGNFLELISDRTRLSLQINYLYGVEPDFEQTFGPFQGQQGQTFHVSDLHAGDAYVSLSFALNNDVRVGDRMVLSLGEKSTTVTVRGILANDVAMASIDANSIPKIQLVVPLATAQYLMDTAQPVNVIGVRNQANATGDTTVQSTQVERFLAQLFHLPVPDPQVRLTAPPNPNLPAISALKTDTVAQASSLSFTLLLGGDSLLQFEQLVPAISLLLIGAGMLLLALLFLLLAAERRAELGMSRAIGLQRHHLIFMLLIEGCGYGVIATLLGLLLGVGVIALELIGLSHFPVNILGSLRGLPMTLHLYVSWQSLISAFCLSLFVTVAVILVIAFSLSRTNIVAAIRDLETPPGASRSLSQLLRGVKARQSDALAALLAGLFLRGPLCLLLGFFLVGIASVLQPNTSDTLTALEKLGWGLLIAGCGFFIRWMFSALPEFPLSFAHRLGNSLIGVGWLAYGLIASNRLFSLFQPTGIMLNTSSAAFDLAMTMLLFIAGSVVLVTANIDLLVALLTALTVHIRSLAPIGRTSLSYPLIYRFRVTVTVSELGLVVFLIVLVITMNVGTINASQAATSTGGFQLSGISTRPIPNLSGLVQQDPVLNRDIQVVAPVHRYKPDSDVSHIDPLLISLPGHQAQPSSLQPEVMDNAFYAHTNFPLQARAQGYSSDQQVWNALIHQPNTAVMRFDSSIRDLPTGTFQPFPAEVPDANHHYHQVMVIGIVAATAQWSFFYFSMVTADAINGGPVQEARQDTGGLGYFFQVRPGVDLARASRDLASRFAPTYGLQVQQLYNSEQNASQANMTLFLGSTLILGLFFGALAIGVITSRSVLERRQQIGMMRALGFSRGLVLCSFLLEASFVITLSLLIGTALALWVAGQITSATYPGFLVPIIPLVLLMIGSYLIALFTTVLPSRAASRVRPAEALRYE
jgi:ABC-type antimicrobial peptide transport system permease subunit